MLEGRDFWALPGLFPSLCRLGLGSACAVPTPFSAGGCWALISCCLQEICARIPYSNGCSRVPLSCSAQWHHPRVPSAGHSQSCSHRAASPTPSQQHPRVASSMARLGRGEIGVQEGLGDPTTLSRDLGPHPNPRGLR